MTHRIHHVSSGPEALDYLSRRGTRADATSSPRPDVVLLDLRLPGMEGLEVLEQMRAHDELREVKVVILTTSEADNDRLPAYQSQISAYIVKPMGFDSFAVLLDVITLAIRD